MWSNHRTLLLAAAALVVALSACAPSETLATPRPAAAAALEDVAPLFSEDFSTKANGWYTDIGKDAVINYAGGGLRIKVWSANYFASSQLGGQLYSDVHLDVTAKDNDPDHNHFLGLICGEQAGGSGLYYFALDPENQAYEIARRSPGSRSDVVLTGNPGWTIDHSIPLNAASYKLGADCGRGMLTFYVNGHMLQSVKESTYESGNVGLFVWSEAASAGPVIFDDVVITGMK